MVKRSFLLKLEKTLPVQGLIAERNTLLGQEVLQLAEKGSKAGRR